MGHLPIVNQETMNYVLEEGYIATRGTLKDRPVKTVSDIFSDVLASRKGDLIFPWIIHSESGENIGFKYVLKVAGPPIFVKGDKYPIKVPLEKEGLVYENPLSEADALDLWEKKLLWNAIGKKSLGRGRSLSHQTPMEDERMLELLNNKNRSGPTKVILKRKQVAAIPLTINVSQDNQDHTVLQRLHSFNEEDRLSQMDILVLPWRKERFFSTEKTLEAWLMENIDKESCLELRKLLLGSDRIIWFGNYLPFGVQGGNMDVVILHTKGSRKIVTIIELKVGLLGGSLLNDASIQVVEYANFLKKAFAAYGLEVFINPVVLFGASKRNSENKKSIPPVKLVTYEINDQSQVIFKNVA